MDNVAKRTFLLYVFLFLIGWYLSSLILHATHLVSLSHASLSTSTFSKDYQMLAQWLFLMNAFFLVVYVLRIPMLRLTFTRFLTLTLTWSLLQVVLLYPYSPVSLRQLSHSFVTWKSGGTDHPPATVDLDIFPRDDLDNGEWTGGISGSFNVHVIPFSSALLVHPAKPACIPLPRLNAKSVVEVQVEVELSGVPPWSLTYSFLSFHSSKTARKTLPAIQTPRLSIAVGEPGLLKLVELQDQKGLGQISNGGDVEIGVCPEAFIHSPERISQLSKYRISSIAAPTNEGQEVCTGDEIKKSVIVYGIPPLHVVLFHKVDGRIADNFTLQHVGDNIKESDAVKSLGSSRPFVVELPTFSYDTVGRHEYFIAQVTDALGIATEYEQGTTADFHAVSVVSRPSATLHCPSDVVSVVVRDDSDDLEVPVDLNVALTGKPPFVLEYTHDARPHVLTNLSTSPVSIPVHKLGTYSVTSIRDANCQSSLQKSSCKFIEMKKPHIQIEFGTLKSACFGSIGFTISLHLSGQAPYIVWYDLTSPSGGKKRVAVKVETGVDELQVKPAVPGEYTLEFVEFKDSRYPHNLKIEGVKETQVFSAPSTAVFVKYPGGKVCQGEAVKFGVQVTGGNGPWLLTYDLITPSSRSRHTIETTSQLVDFDMDKVELAEGGKYFLEIKSVKDGNDCENHLHGVVASFEVVTDRPSASFSFAKASALKSFEVKEGASVSIPLVLSGLNGPWSLALEFKAAEDRDWTPLTPLTLHNRESQIVASKPGWYRLKEVRDSVCPGHVDQTVVAQVVTIPKPTARIGGSELVDGVCLGMKEPSFKVEMEGRPPFVLKYSSASTSNDKSPEVKELMVATKEAFIDLQTSKPGEFTYNLLSISDAVYENVELSGLHFEYRVFALPDVKFAERDATKSVCMHQPLDIALEFTGAPSFHVEYEIASMAKDSQISTIEKSQEFTTGNKGSISMEPFSSPGRYEIRLKSLIDANRCAAAALSKKVVVDVMREPQFMPLFETGGNGCVGDKLAFLIYGEAPWTLGYSWLPFRSTKAEEQHELRIEDEESGKGSGRGWIASGNKLISHLFSTLDKDDELRSLLPAHKQQRKNTPPDSSDSFKRKKLWIKLRTPGTLTITSICHGQSGGQGGAVCCAKVEDVAYTIHPIPSAVVSGGGVDAKSDIVIRQGNEAKMRIEFKGQGPFGFTYARFSESSNAQFPQEPPLETSTVTDIREEMREITLSQAGRYVVTSIKDKFCRYPPDFSESSKSKGLAA